MPGESRRVHLNNVQSTTRKVVTLGHLSFIMSSLNMSDSKYYDIKRRINKYFLFNYEYHKVVLIKKITHAFKDINNTMLIIYCQLYP